MDIFYFILSTSSPPLLLPRSESRTENSRPDQKFLSRFHLCFQRLKKTLWLSDYLLISNHQVRK